MKQAEIKTMLNKWSVYKHSPSGVKGQDQKHERRNQAFQ